MSLTLTEVAVGYSSRRSSSRRSSSRRSSSRRPSTPPGGNRSGSDRLVLTGVDAVAPAGMVTAVIGPNGAGKSTLLRSLLGLQPLLAGSVTLAGRDLLALSPRDRARASAVVLTDRVEVGLLTGRQVAELGRYPAHGLLAGRLGRAERTLVETTLERLGATDLAGARFAELSDGQRQRILLARALVSEPELLVLDEPSAFLDVGARVDLMALLAEVAMERGIVVLVSTHEVELALRLAERVFLVHAGGLRAGTPAELIGDGAVGATFDTERSRFDPASGSFVLRP